MKAGLPLICRHGCSPIHINLHHQCHTFLTYKRRKWKQRKHRQIAHTWGIHNTNPVEEKMSRRRMKEMVEMDPLKGLQSNLCFEDECVAIMNSGWCTHLVDKDVEKA